MPVSKKRKKKKKRSRINSKIYINHSAIEIKQNFEVESISKILENMDEHYIEVESKAIKYFNDTFEAHLESLINKISKIKYLTMESFDGVFKAHVKEWMNEINEFSNVFQFQIISYTNMIVKEEIESIFDDLLLEINNESVAKTILKKAVENIFSASKECSYIYIEEFNDLVIQLLESKYDVINNKIICKVKEISFEYNYQTNIIIDYDIGKLEYIDKYKELNKLAEKNGYIHVRDNGGHGIFINNKTEKIVVIPQGRRIGKGLSFKIQKQIASNSNKDEGLEKVINNSELAKYSGELEVMSNSKKSEKDILEYIDSKPELFYKNTELNKKVLDIKEAKIICEVKEYIENEEFESALNILIKFNSQYPQALASILMIAIVYEQSGNNIKAIEYLKQYVDRNGEFYDAYVLITELLNQCGRYEEAEYYEMVKMCKFSDKLHLLEKIKEAIVKEKFELAKELVDKFESQSHASLSADDFLEIGQRYFAVGNFKMAREFCKKALIKYPDKVEAKQLIKMMDAINL